MDQRAHKLVIDAAEFDVTIGVATGLGMVALRGLVLLGALFGGSPIDGWLLAQIVVQTVLAAVFTIAVRRRRPWGAVGLLIVWGVGYFYSWYALGRLVPPLGIIGILVWYGLYRGLRGTRLLAAQARIAAAAV